MAASIDQTKLSIQPPCDWEELLAFFATRAVPNLETVSNQHYQRTLTFEGQVGWINISKTEEASPPTLLVQSKGVRVTKTLQSVVTRVFDLDAPTHEIKVTLSLIPQLTTLVPTFAGLRVPGAWSLFEIGVRAILGQQVTVRAARTLAERLVTQYGSSISSTRLTPSCTRTFPSPADLIEAPLERIGIPGKRAHALRTFCQLMHDLGEHPADNNSFCNTLLAIPGIGPWTVNYIRMRGLKDRDAFPVGDIALLNAAKYLGIAQTFAQLKRQAEAWRPYRAYATIALWRLLSVAKKN